jgi:hypothetical protein
MKKTLTVVRDQRAAQAEFQATYRRGAIDKLGDVRERLAKVKGDMAADAAICKEIRETWMAGWPLSSPQTFTGDRYMVVVKASKFERVVDKVRLWKHVGQTAFLRACGVTVKAFEALVPAYEREGFLSMEQTGSREIDVVPLPDVAQAKKAA